MILGQLYPSPGVLDVHRGELSLPKPGAEEALVYGPGSLAWAAWRSQVPDSSERVEVTFVTPTGGVPGLPGNGLSVPAGRGKGCGPTWVP